MDAAGELTRRVDDDGAFLLSVGVARAGVGSDPISGCSISFATHQESGNRSVVRVIPSTRLARIDRISGVVTPVTSSDDLVDTPPAGETGWSRAPIDIPAAATTYGDERWGAEMQSAYAAPIEHRVESRRAGEVIVHEHAGPEGAPVLVLLHGLGATASLNWGRCYRPLSEHFRVLSLDHRGHGRGLRTRRFRLEQCADDAVAAARAVGVERFIAVGYSMGGPIASLAWRRHPEHVEGLVLCATARHFAPRGLARLARVSLPFAAAAVRVAPGLLHQRATQRMLQSVEHPALRDHIRDELLGHDPATVVQATQAVATFSSHDWIGEVGVPTSVIVTTRDELVPPSRQRKLAESISSARVFEVAGDHAACAVRGSGFVPTLVEACHSVAERIAGGPTQDARLGAQRAPAGHSSGG